MSCSHMCLCVFFFNDTATTEIYTLSLHDALPIWQAPLPGQRVERTTEYQGRRGHHHRRAPEEAAREEPRQDRKSTRLNSSHANISYAVFCLKKKNTLYKLRLHKSA